MRHGFKNCHGMRPDTAKRLMGHRRIKRNFFADLLDGPTCCVAVKLTREMNKTDKILTGGGCWGGRRNCSENEENGIPTRERLNF